VAFQLHILFRIESGVRVYTDEFVADSDTFVDVVMADDETVDERQN